MKKTLKGFTLIEMLIVIVIIGILAAVLIPKIGGARERAEDVAVKSNVRTISTYLMTKSMDRNMPTTLDWTDTTNMPTVATADQSKYSYGYSGNKFMVCGKIISTDGNFNAAATSTNCTSHLLETGDYYCIQG